MKIFRKDISVRLLAAALLFATPIACVNLEVEADTFAGDVEIFDNNGGTTDDIVYGTPFTLRLKSNHDHVCVESYKCTPNGSTTTEFPDNLNVLNMKSNTSLSKGSSDVKYFYTDLIICESAKFDNNHVGTLEMVLYDDVTNSRQTIRKEYYATFTSEPKMRLDSRHWDIQGTYKADSNHVTKKNLLTEMKQTGCDTCIHFNVYPSGTAEGGKKVYKSFVVKSVSVYSAADEHLTTDIELNKEYIATTEECSYAFNASLANLKSIDGDEYAKGVRVYLEMEVYNPETGRTSRLGADKSVSIVVYKSFYPGEPKMISGSEENPAKVGTPLKIQYKPSREMLVTNYTAVNNKTKKEEDSFVVANGKVKGRDADPVSISGLTSNSIYPDSEGNVTFEFEIDKLDEREDHEGTLTLTLENEQTKQKYTEKINYHIARNLASNIDIKWSVGGSEPAYYNDTDTLFVNADQDISFTTKFTPDAVQEGYTIKTSEYERVAIYDGSSNLVSSLTKGSITAKEDLEFSLRTMGNNKNVGGGLATVTVCTTEGKVSRKINIFVRHRFALVLYGSFADDVGPTCSHGRDVECGWYGIVKNLEARIVRFKEGTDERGGTVISNLSWITQDDSVFPEKYQNWKATYSFSVTGAKDLINYNTWGKCFDGARTMMLDCSDPCDVIPCGKHTGWPNEGQVRANYGVKTPNKTWTASEQKNIDFTKAYTFTESFIYNVNYYNDETAECTKFNWDQMYNSTQWNSVGFEITNIEYDQKKIEIRWIINDLSGTWGQSAGSTYWWGRKAGIDIMQPCVYNPYRPKR